MSLSGARALRVESRRLAAVGGAPFPTPSGRATGPERLVSSLMASSWRGAGMLAAKSGRMLSLLRVISLGVFSLALTAGCSDDLRRTGRGAERDPATTRGCPDEVPDVDTACRSVVDLCDYRRNGPCPPDPDQLRRCVDGKWVALAPTIACGPIAGRAAPDVDAGAD